MMTCVQALLGTNLWSNGSGMVMTLQNAEEEKKEIKSMSTELEKENAMLTQQALKLQVDLAAVTERGNIFSLL